MAVHPLYAESSFDELLNTLLERKRALSHRMLIPPVHLEQDQSWFADNLGRRDSEMAVPSTDIEEIDAMEPHSFERWVLSRCTSVGWEVSRTPRSHDGGADGILVHRESKARAIVQCKHKQKNSDACDSEAIDDLLRARANYPATARLFALTNAEKFTRAAYERAKEHGVVLVARKELPHWPRHLI
jgi:HJR/Mrr/RecB family endonuclease